MIIDMTNGKEYPLWRNAVLYSELEERLDGIAKRYPANVRIEKMGKSNEGRDLYLVILAEDVTDEGIAKYEAFRKTALREPKRVLTGLENGENYKIPLFFNANLHGTEISGTDGLLLFIEELLAGDKAALRNAFIAISICENPDGRFKGYDILNGNCADLNRDFCAQTQPETRAIIERAIVRFLPSIMVDFHGFMSSGDVLIDTCTPPHNPNTEYDLLEEHLHKDAQAMADAIYKKMRVKSAIPALIWEDGWEDYSPVYTATFCQNFGCIAHTLETTFPNEDGMKIDAIAAAGALEYALKNKKRLLEGQCRYFLRGIEGTSKAPARVPAYYVIPFSRETQRDRETAAGAVKKLLRCGIRVFRAEQSGDYVIPTAQALRGLINGTLWQGEDITQKIKNLYDVSFDSEPIMRGFDIRMCESLDSGEKLTEIAEAPLAAGTLNLGGEEDWHCFTSGKNSSVKLANLLLDSGIEVYRGEGSENADFYFRGDSCLGLVKKFVDGHDLAVGPAALPEKTYRLKKQKALIVADSAGAYEVLSDWGFDVTMLPFSALNRGYEIHPEDYDLLIFGGTRLHIWSDPFDEDMGVGYGTSWALRGRGRTELIRAAKEFKNLILFGYAGNALNEELGLIHQAKGDEEQKNNQENLTDWHLNTGSGSFKLRFDVSDPLCGGFREEETVYLVGPLPLTESDNARVVGNFGENAFLNGWCTEKEHLNGKPVLLYRKEDSGTKILMGIDPCYRRYVDATYRLMSNAVYLVGKE